MKSGRLLLMAAALAIPAIVTTTSTAVAAPTATSSSDLPDQTVTMQVTAACKEVYTYHLSFVTPILGDPSYVAHAKITQNPCSLRNGLEAALTITTVVDGIKGSRYGNDVHKVNVDSTVSADEAKDFCDRYGARWWNGSAWQYSWSNC